VHEKTPRPDRCRKEDYYSGRCDPAIEHRTVAVRTKSFVLPFDLPSGTGTEHVNMRWCPVPLLCPGRKYQWECRRHLHVHDNERSGLLNAECVSFVF
jgi:hypothetical protein